MPLLWPAIASSEEETCSNTVPDKTCDNYKKYGFCADGHKEVKNMKLICKKTCGFCGGGSGT